jgi:hypothetical protein
MTEMTGDSNDFRIYVSNAREAERMMCGELHLYQVWFP